MELDKLVLYKCHITKTAWTEVAHHEDDQTNHQNDANDNGCDPVTAAYMTLPALLNHAPLARLHFSCTLHKLG